jgi:hypothetical protein
MVNIERVRIAWTGFPGGPGVATMYAHDGAAAMTPLQAMFDQIKASLPTNVNIQVESYGDIIDPANGDLMGGWTGTAQDLLTGADGATYPAPAGGIISWTTGTIVDGHRLKGRTYLVPMGGASYQGDGTINTANVGSISAYALELVEAGEGNFVVWHRPRVAKAADGSRPAVTARAGSYGEITGGGLRDKVVVLRSRRQG